jgi:hypothetical protein
MKLSDEMLNMARRVEEMELTIARLIDAMAGIADQLGLAPVPAA